jgi:Lrp/AsnC family leucine-responsive transcriptional regulator
MIASNLMTTSKTDLQILRILQHDASISNVELAERIRMSPSPCLRRVKQLEASGLIERYVALLDRRKAGFGILAHVEVKVPQISSTTVVERFSEAVKKEPAVVSCFMTTGDFDFLLKVVARDMDEFSDLAVKRLMKLPGVQHMRSSFVLTTVKDSVALPI